MSDNKNPTFARQLSAGLRALADFLDANEEALAPTHPSTLTSVYLHPNDAATLAAIARAALAAGAKVDKEIEGDAYNLALSWGPVKANALAWRRDVCERIVTGTTTITRTVPDPEALAAVPTVEITETVEHVEWHCTPLLAADTEQVTA